MAHSDLWASAVLVGLSDPIVTPLTPDAGSVSKLL